MSLYIEGFPPIIDEETRVLVLGSMPGEASLDAHLYYAHPRNVFWSQMSTIFSFDPACDYTQRTQFLLDNRLGLWDVLARCIRPGSLDSHIRRDSVELNDFCSLFQKYSQLRAVLFNGQKAAHFFKPVARQLESEAIEYRSQIMPSTSPAHAAMPADEKLRRWQTAIEDMLH